MSLRVRQAVEAFLEQALRADGPANQWWELRSEAARAACAKLVGAQTDEIAFVKNTSEGLSLVASGFPWQAGDNVIAVDQEYPSNIYPWFALRARGVETRLVARRNGLVSPDDVVAVADRRTRLLSVSFVDWLTGARNDLAALGQLCRERGWLFCVDGIQGVGAVPLQVESLGIDCLAVGGHKWLLAPEGCGFLYVSRRVIDRLDSVLHGWKSVYDENKFLPYHFEPRRDALKFEPGSPPHMGIHALGSAVELLLEVGREEVWRRIRAVTDRLVDGLHPLGAEILSPLGEHQRSGIIVFRLPGRSSEGLTQRLDKRGFIVRVRNGGIRVAPHFYNTTNDIDRFLEALQVEATRSD
ncbi:MAG: aminotransferase class V-fold PLP-dependent enzyme [Candidatus Binatia bacterium]|nr:aminotransferase class V-fold PLP-dependent enzyme [Candidatus Binatia bacterium]